MQGARSKQVARRQTPDRPVADAEVARLLDHRFGDGLVYLREPSERGTLERAMALGLVSAEGYLTEAGLALVAHFDAD